jgi:opacity protein-like surface antigen
MRKSAPTILPLFLLVLAVPSSAWAQDFPKVELFGGYSYVRMLGDNWSGWNIAATKNFSQNLGITADISSFGNSVSQDLTGYAYRTDGHEYTFMIGPQFKARGPQKMSPFGHFLFGAAHHYSNYSELSGNTLIPFQSWSSNRFAMGAGGGVDYKLAGHLLLRGQIDYMGIRFGMSGTTQSAWAKFWRLTAGVVLPLGHKSY